MSKQKTLSLRQTWFLGVMLVVVVGLFAFVVLPYVDRKKPSKVGQEAPTLALELLVGGDAGDRVDLARLRGQVVVLDFFASWCVPCRQQAPAIEQLAHDFAGKDVYVLGVGTSDTREALEGYLRETKPSHPIAFDEENVAGNAYGVSQLPTIVIVDRSGRMTTYESRVLDQRELTQYVTAALSTQ